MVIVDAPPLLPVTDAAVLTAVADGAFIVISSGKTLDSELGAALGHLQAVRGKALGVIFNRVPRRDSTSGYYGGNYRSSASAEAAADMPVVDAKPVEEPPVAQPVRPTQARNRPVPTKRPQSGKRPRGPKTGAA